jgi:hypothetical protein
MNYEQKQKDLEYGLSQEDLLLNYLNDKFPNTIKNKDTYNHFDFRNDELGIDFELKSRRIYKGQYSTIFFAIDKLEYGRMKLRTKKSKRIIYIFNFVKKNNKQERDYWFWEDDGSKMEIVKNGNLARGDIKKDLVNLNINLLKSINDLF